MLRRFPCANLRGLRRGLHRRSRRGRPGLARLVAGISPRCPWACRSPGYSPGQSRKESRGYGVVAPDGPAGFAPDLHRAGLSAGSVLSAHVATCGHSLRTAAAGSVSIGQLAAACESGLLADRRGGRDKAIKAWAWRRSGSTIGARVDALDLPFLRAKESTKARAREQLASAFLPSSPAWYPLGVPAVCRGYRRFCRKCRRLGPRGVLADARVLPRRLYRGGPPRRSCRVLLEVAIACRRSRRVWIRRLPGALGAFAAGRSTGAALHLVRGLPLASALATRACLSIDRQ